ncbi:MAG TPA: hypothetical protein DEF43_04525 [Chloroflexus aurantiacus]|uniref:Uncharacterized protein n=1 Tax=Chloroflexus aurantiacus (strain ATCC 29366 / DSM 635 / J-10-fl) TaxID=324602 RepID=A9WG44_CHLAA|nr:hypothetical protein Caur_2999 [Chloroflexus aurantiacus J-10-fl]RMG53018.1 MAG: hypothetical protein D6716_02010 [Chloroflexota bacterium]HBW66424.1 hypothetical protein [Chloroflexus aurantiacus]
MLIEHSQFVSGVLMKKSATGCAIGEPLVGWWGYTEWFCAFCCSARVMGGEHSMLVLYPAVICDTPPPQPAPARGGSLWCDPTVAI